MADETPVNTKPTKELVTPGDISLEVVELQSVNGDILDIKNFVSELNIYEDIFSNSLNGALIVVDSADLLAGLPLVGDELINIWVRTPSFDDSYGESIKKSFSIYSIKNRALTSDREQVYVLYFCSLEGLGDNVTQVSAKFEGTTDEIADKIYTEYVKQQRCYGTLESEDITPMIIADAPHDSKTAFVSNMWSPFRCLNYVAKRSIGNKQKSPSFLFYETTKQFYFTSIDNLIKSQLDQSMVFAEYMYLQKPFDESRENEESGFSVPRSDLVRQFNIVQEIRFPEQIDLLKSQDNGRFASTTTVLDLSLKEFTNWSWDYGYSYPDYIHMENYKIENGEAKFDGEQNDNMTYPANVTRSALSKSFYRTVHQKVLSDDAELIEYDPSKFLPARQSVLEDISGLRMHITVPGRTDAEVGKLINFRYPKVGDGADKTDETLWDPFLSGVWMITAIHHKITPMAHKMILEIAKDSFHTAFQFIERAPDPNMAQDDPDNPNNPENQADPSQSSEPVAVNKEGWTSPMAGGKVISPFGNRIHPVKKVKSFHTGVDLVKGGDLGRPILAAKGGKVIFAGDKGANGNLIKIDHGGGYVTAYGHGQNGSFKVKTGDTVKAGQHIMNCGSTGRSTGPHLHFEVQLNGKPIDPQPIFGWSRYGK